jgi:CDP-diacylglycerol--serine O-phosphatidyltransferase
MISTVRYNNFKELGIFSRRPRVTLVAAAMAIALIFRYSEQTLLVLAVSYAASGPVLRLVHAVRKSTPLGASAERQSMEVHRREP